MQHLSNQVISSNETENDSTMQSSSSEFIVNNAENNVIDCLLRSAKRKVTSLVT